ncbi:ABC transporter ATP-binding protein [Angustibacter sp. McL0619]|uniref:ABC transporter ATP-binding protein n=1 Tax=Angustibacter sp. McL0619 TaxID=3415676 RepID=UPI003CEA18B4
MPGPDDDAVVVRGLVRSYGPVRAVDGLDLLARRGEVTAVLGPNGAGKTTTLECCEGLRRADSGTVRVLGADPHLAGPGHRARVGVMLQDGGLPTGAHAAGLVRHVSRMHAHPVDPATLCAELGIDAFARTTVRRLSGGQRQRLALACALVGRPEVLFLDEPSAGLDPQARQAVWSVLADVRSAGTAVVLTTHYMEEAERLADVVFVVDGGRVVAHGSPAELTSGTSADVARFSARPALDLDTLRRALDPAVSVVEHQPGQYLLEGKIGPQVLATLTSWCVSQGVMPDGLTVGRRSLEDVFLELTGRQLR